MKNIMESKGGQVVLVVVKVVLLFTSLYFFICSLSFLSDSFRILGGRSLGAFFENSDLLNNPVVGVMIGVIVTVLVQSSSTSTSIIVGLVAAGTPVKTAIPMIMGANIGTSVTNTIVSFTQAHDREEFKRAFACATVHDMFNWLTVIILVIVETVTGFLDTMTGAMVKNLGDARNNSKPPDFLKVLTKPLTKAIVQLDKKVLKGWANNDVKYENASILKHGCKTEDGVWSCKYLWAYLGPEGADISDSGAGVILLIISLIILCSCLIFLVKILNSLLGDKVKELIRTRVNSDIPCKYLSWLTGYLVMLVGAVLTVLVQSSSVFTSTLTPLAGAGLVSLERAYPLTLGSNIGTTTTSLLAALASSGDHAQEAVQIALVHLFFNITGILIFYPIPLMRWPIWMAQSLGNVTSQYRWFALCYLLFAFLIIPTIIFGISLAGNIAMYIILIPISLMIIFVVIINVLQTHRPSFLPEVFRSWDFLPEALRSLDPLDRLLFGCIKTKSEPGEGQTETDLTPGKEEKAMTHINLGFEKDNRNFP